MLFSKSSWVACWLTEFSCSSSGALKFLNSDSHSRCVRICSFLPFWNWLLFVDFFKCGGVLACMKCSTMAWASIPNASFSILWSLSREPTTIWFDGLKTRFCSLGFVVAFNGGLTFFLWKTVEIYPRLSRVGLLMFLKFCNASRLISEWQQLILSSSVSWLWILSFV